jgi:hemoglobin
MKNILFNAVAIFLAVVNVTAQAQGMNANMDMVQSSASAYLYHQLGERAGIQGVVDKFLPIVQADGRISSFFNGANMTRLNKMLVDQICNVSGGPCKYSGADMKTAHSGMQIGKADFNALVEDLQQALDASKVPFAVQNQLLAALAPMNRDVIQKH